MEMRVYGRSGMRLSALGFGCGAVGGLMVRGDPRDQERAVARAIEAGVNYFDTAVQYGDGESENNLGRVLQSLKLPARSSAPRCDYLPPMPGGSARRLRGRLTPAWRGCGATTSISSTCTIRSPSAAAVRRSRCARCWTRWCRHSSACANRARSAFSGSPPSAIRRRCIRSSVRANSTARKWSTTCSIRPRPLACRQIIRRKTMIVCSMRPRSRAPASSLFACSPAARCPDQRRGIRSQVRRPRRSGRR